MDQDSPKSRMVYRYLGNSGLKVSVLSFGNWITGHDDKAEAAQIECIKKAYEYGVNFFDTAEIYGAGVAEGIMGKAIKQLDCKRKDIIVSTKFFKCGDGINDNFLSRKHITEAMQNSLKRLDLEYVDIVFCHRPDFDTPLEETCRAMHGLIEDGYSFYWATSEWTPERVSQAMEICKRLKLHKPIADQCEYSALMRDNFEKNLRTCYETYKYGTTIWSPLAGGILTGKYNDGNIPEGTRYKDNDFAANVVWQKYFNEKKKDATLKILGSLKEVAEEQKCSMAQLSLAWTIVNQDVSTCIFGASKVSQLEDNIKALEIAENWTEDLEKKINDILGNEPDAQTDFNTWKPMVSRRAVRVDYSFKADHTPHPYMSFQESNYKKEE
jgi:voltage-dependent potassium channel beta subunit